MLYILRSFSCYMSIFSQNFDSQINLVKPQNLKKILDNEGKFCSFVIRINCISLYLVTTKECYFYALYSRLYRPIKILNANSIPTFGIPLAIKFIQRTHYRDSIHIFSQFCTNIFQFDTLYNVRKIFALSFFLIVFSLTIFLSDLLVIIN